MKKLGSKPEVTRFKGLGEISPDEFARFIKSPVLSRDDQSKGIAAVAAHAKLSDLTQKFLGLVARNRRLFALPGMIQKLRRLGCAPSTVGLVIPTGYSFNLDGTNIYMTMAALFIAQATGVHLSLGDQLALLGVAMLSSKGAAGVTGAGFITLAATLAVVPEVPVAGMALILGVDRFMSECRSLTNFIGNAVATIVVSRWEGKLDHEALDAALHGRAVPAARA